ncbi:MAG: BlaI/MecI/CopY family transcriptional regulator [Solirubrobacterales bacterium]
MAVSASAVRRARAADGQARILLVSGWKSRSIAPPLHELEAEVMEEVWRRGAEVAVRDVLEALNARNRRKRAYTTVMTIMSRLHTKRLLIRELRGKTHFYRAAMGRDAYRDARAHDEVESLVADFGDLALAHFARRVEGLDAKSLRKLRELAGGG